MALTLSVPALGAESSVPLLSVTPGAGGQVIGVPGASLPWLLLVSFFAGLTAGIHCLHPHRGGAVPVAAGTGQPHRAAEPGADGAGGAADDFRDVAGVEDHRQRGVSALSGGGDEFQRSRRTRCAAAEKLHAAANARRRPQPVHRGDKTIDPKKVDSVPLAALAPAFLTSELKTPSRSASWWCCRSW